MDHSRLVDIFDVVKRVLVLIFIIQEHHSSKHFNGLLNKRGWYGSILICYNKLRTWKKKLKQDSSAVLICFLLVIKISPWNTFLFFRKGQHRGAEGTRRRRVSVDVQYILYILVARDKYWPNQGGVTLSDSGEVWYQILDIAGTGRLVYKKLQHPLTEDEENSARMGIITCRKTLKNMTRVLKESTIYSFTL